MNKITDFDIKSNTSPVFYYEDFLQYDKVGHFLKDCSHIIEVYIYYFVFSAFAKMVYSLLKKIISEDNLFMINLKNGIDYLLSRSFLFRIFNETYVYLLLFGLYMELNIYFPIKPGNFFILNDTYVIVNKIMMRLMVIIIGFGFPTYLISRILMYGRGEDIDKDLKFMIEGCKLSAKTARVIPILVIARKFVVVLYVLPCFAKFSMGTALLVVLIQVSILTLLVNGFPFKTVNMNIVALVSNLLFLVTSWVFFINEIMSNFIELSYITTEDFGNNQNSQNDIQVTY
jgi:hypothetical protein